MIDNGRGSGGVGLERSCADGASDWLRSTHLAAGVELLEAWFRGPAYRTHRHDTYAIGLTATGVQAFAYRGATHVSTPGHVVVLHPDEPHDGHAGTDEGFGYRQLYVEPAVVLAVVRDLAGAGSTLPFLRQPVTVSEKLAAAIRDAFRGDRDSLAIDHVVGLVAEGLLEADPNSGCESPRRRLDHVAVARARQFLDAERCRVVHSAELEAVTGVSRFQLARQFRAAVGVSPYRYSLMRRLETARAQLSEQAPLAAVALDSGFSDQAHFTRLFAAQFGMTPARYRALLFRGNRRVVESMPTFPAFVHRADNV